MQYPAHIRMDSDGNPPVVQSVEAHCTGVSVLAEQTLKPLGLGTTGRLLGMVHDLGKFTAEFKAYIQRAANGEPVIRGSVNHTFAGVRLLFEQFHGAECATMEDLACELLAAAVGSHHGLFDCIGERGEDGFTHRLEKELPAYEEAREQFFACCMSKEQLASSFVRAADEISVCAEKLEDISGTDDEASFHTALLCRFLTSALINADRRDTAEFMNGAVFPDPPTDLREFWTPVLARVEGRIAGMQGGGAVNAARREISDVCRAAADRPDGIHRLSVPTGSGKTLCALRYALAKAKSTGKQRIFFVTSLLTVLEQNAKVLHDFIGDDSLILEHHSNLLQEETDGTELDPRELFMETYNAPVVITTLVQLLNTLFAGKPSCIRRMQALSDSVIVIDEVQSVPGKLLSLFDLALNFLAKVCGAEIVLCSATQPCLEETAHAVLYQEPAELVPWSESVWQPFCRTKLIDRRQESGCTLEELADFGQEILQDTDSLLIICNLKTQARTLYHLLKGCGAAVFHLSASMCMAHRQKTLQKVNEALAQTQSPGGKKLICVATQLVEAGVDFSFGSVIRVLAGMDNAVQSAGRCNRSGERASPCPVYLVQVRDEHLGPLKDIQRAQNASKNLLAHFAQNPASFGGDLASAESIRFYYRDLFGTLPAQAQDFTLPKLSTSLYELLSDNGHFRDFCKSSVVRGVNQAFKTAGDHFEVFDEAATDVLAPFEGGADCIADLNSQKAKHDPAFCAAVLKRAKPYTVSLYENQMRRLQKSGGLAAVLDGAVWVLADGFYDQETGADPDGGAGSFMGV